MQQQYSATLISRETSSTSAHSVNSSKVRKTAATLLVSQARKLTSKKHVLKLVVLWPGFAILNAGYVRGKRARVFAKEISFIASARKSGHGVICCVKASVARASVITQGSLSTVAS